MKQLTPAITGIIAANLLLFILTYYVPGMDAKMIHILALHYPANDSMHLWQLVTHMFMHGGVMHIAFNMLGVYMFGSPLEKLWGAKRFLIFYFIAGIGAGLIYTGINVLEFNGIVKQLFESGVPKESIQRFLATRYTDPGLRSAASSDTLGALWSLYHVPMLGASGALYGVLVAFATLFPNVKLALIFFPVPIAAKYFVPIIVLIDLFSGITGFSLFGGGIAHFAHIGGALIGFLLMWYWREKHRPHYPYFD